MINYKLIKSLNPENYKKSINKDYNKITKIYEKVAFIKKDILK